MSSSPPPPPPATTTTATGIGAHASSEALPGALPERGNNPQRCAYGLYAEQLSGTAFTAPRHKNFRSWLYRIRPGVLHGPLEKLEHAGNLVGRFGEGGTALDPNQMRWAPPPVPPAAERKVDFVDGLNTYAGTGDCTTKSGLAIHVYTCNASMGNRALCNADGDLLVVPQEGALRLETEFGPLDCPPRHVVVVPRGVRFSVNLVQDGAPARGYVLELFEGHFELPGLGPIGANGLANPRDVALPSAAFTDDDSQPWELVQKFGGSLWKAALGHCPFDVAAWHGNYYPFVYVKQENACCCCCYYCCCCARVLRLLLLVLLRPLRPLRRYYYYYCCYYYSY